MILNIKEKKNKNKKTYKNLKEKIFKKNKNKDEKI